MYENAVKIDPDFALAHAGIANVCVLYYFDYDHAPKWIERAVEASERASALGRHLPEVQTAEAWIYYREGRLAEAVELIEKAVQAKPDCEGAYYLLGRALFSAGDFQALAAVADTAIDAAGDDYNVYVPIMNSLGALGKEERVSNLRQRAILILETQIMKVPEDARARSLLAVYYADLDRADDAVREMQFALTLRPKDPTLAYNAACTYAGLGKKSEALETLRRAWDFGYRDASWVRNDPDLEILHDDPEFDRMYPPG
jgi:tetratricopeptide (TPR) repeat protein